MPQVVILPHVIEQKLKLEERQEVITFINELIADTSSELKRDVIEVVGEKFERRLSEEIANLKTELIERIANSETKMTANYASLEAKMTANYASLEAKMTERIANTETKLTERIANTETKMANQKAEIIKWMFIFWIGNVVTIIGGMVGILKLAKVF